MEAEILSAVSGVGWDWFLDFKNRRLVLEAPTKNDADTLLDTFIDALISSAAKIDPKRGSVVLRWKWPKWGHPSKYEIEAAMMSEGNEEKEITPAPRTNTKFPNLRNAGYLDVLEFLQEQRSEGRIVIITSQIDDVCIHTNDLLLPERGVYRPYQWRGYNYLRSWDVRRDQSDGLQPSEEYHSMRTLLERDGTIPAYSYRLRRPDGALCEYSTDYYHVSDYCGEPVRIGVSRPEDWRIIEPAVAR